MEEWKPIVGVAYDISSLGRVRSRHPNVRKKASEGILKPHLNAYGYHSVNLYDADGKSKTILVHRLVGDAFLEKPAHATEIDHINRVRTDNRLENLRWVARPENALNKGNTREYPSIRQVYIVCLSPKVKKQFATLEEAEAFITSSSQGQSYTAE